MIEEVEMLKNSIVLVTGASSGIGLECARAFAREGARVIIAARRVGRLAEIASELSSRYGAEVHILDMDVRNREVVNKAIGSLPPEWREIDILVNNAGLSRGLDKIHEGNPEGYDEMIDTNVKGVLWVSLAVIPGMVRRDKGHIINIGSIAGREVYLGGSVYCATKHALRAITQGLRIDLSGTMVRVSSVDPGMVETEFSKVRFWGDEERARKVYEDFPPLKPEDVAEAVIFCATRPSHVNVSEILIMPTDQANVHVHYKRGR